MKEDSLLWESVADDYLSLMNNKRNILTGIKLRKLVLHPRMSSIIEKLDGTNVLDLGCGNGWLSELFSGQIEKVVGIDIAFSLLQNATRNGYCVTLSDITTYLPFRSNCFDIIAANLVFQWLDDISVCLNEANRVLKSNGSVVLSIAHPYFSNKAGVWDKSDTLHPVFKIESLKFFKREAFIGLNLEENPVGPLNYYNRLISEYVNAFIGAGFLIQRMEEIFCGDEVLSIEPSWIRHANLPLFIIFVLRK